MTPHTAERLASQVVNRLEGIVFEVLEPYDRCYWLTDLCVIRDEEYGYLYLNFRHPFLKSMVFRSKRDVKAFEAKMYEVTKLKLVINEGIPIYLH